MGRTTVSNLTLDDDLIMGAFQIAISLNSNQGLEISKSMLGTFDPSPFVGPTSMQISI